MVADERGPVLVLTRGDHRLNEIKLANALDELGLDVTGLDCLDVGASTGGAPAFLLLHSRNASTGTRTTMTLTNPGTVGTRLSVPRLMPNQGLIVGVGAIGYPSEYEASDPRALAQLVANGLGAAGIVAALVAMVAGLAVLGGLLLAAIISGLAWLPLHAIDRAGVGQLQRTHGMVHSQLHDRVDGFLCSDALLKGENRFVDHGA